MLTLLLVSHLDSISSMILQIVSLPDPHVSITLQHQDLHLWKSRQNHLYNFMVFRFLLPIFLDLIHQREVYLLIRHNLRYLSTIYRMLLYTIFHLWISSREFQEPYSLVFLHLLIGICFSRFHPNFFYGKSWLFQNQST